MARASTPSADWLGALACLPLPAPPAPSTPFPSGEPEQYAWHLALGPQALQVDVFHCLPALQGWREGERLLGKDLPAPGAPGWDSLSRAEQAAFELLRRWRRQPAGIPFALLAALEGHGRISFAQTLGQSPRRVSLVREVATLEISESDAGWRVRLWPRPGAGATRLHLDEDRLSFTGFLPLHHELDRLLGPGRIAPAQDEERLAKALGRLVPHLPLLTDLLPEPAPPGAPPDRSLRLWTRWQGERLDLALRVQPAPGLRQVLPGEGPRFAVAGSPRRLWIRDLPLEGHRARQVLDHLEPVAKALPQGLWRIDERQRACAFLAGLRPMGRRIRLEGVPGFRAELPRLVESVDWIAELIPQGSGTELRASLGPHPLIDLLPTLQSGPRFLHLGSGLVLNLANELGRRIRWLAAWCRPENGALRLPAAGLSLVPLPGRPSLDELPPPLVPTAFLGELRDYQRVGFEWMAVRLQAKLGACLADDMGLGKTVQTAALLAHRAAEGPALVVAPASVQLVWTAELARFVPSLKVRRLAEGGSPLKDPEPGQVILASYGLLASRAQKLQAVEWTTVVLDEAHAIKNPGTQRAQISRQLRTRCRLALTGTPVENRPEELASLMAWLLPDAEPLLQGASIEQLRAMAAPFLLRRRKTEVLKELPPKTEQTLCVALDPVESDFHRALRERLCAEALGGSAIHLLAALMTLRRACAHPVLVEPGYKGPAAKTDLLMDRLALLQEEGQRSLVFSQFTDLLDLLEPRLDAAGISWCRLDGSLSLKARQTAITAFQSGERSVFLLSLRAGGTGLNLTAADHVFHLDPWWNPAVEDQATDRAHRMGRTRPVAVHRLVAEGTVEARVLELHQQKRQMIEQLLEDRTQPSSLDRGLLEQLLGI